MNYALLLLQMTITLFLGGSAVSLILGGKKHASLVIFSLSAAASLCAIAFASNQFLSDGPTRFSFKEIFPLVGFDVLVDNTCAFFIFLIGVISLAVSVYSIGYAKKYGKISSFGFLFNFFIVSMILVTVSNNVFSFLIFWELMSLTSFFLVIYEHESQNNRKAAINYLVMTHFGTAFIATAFLLSFVQTGSFSFDSFRQLGSNSIFKDAIFVFALIGFGTKAGMMPFHTWLPQAHPAAPSNVSALMSAVMLKIAIYGMMRFLFDFNNISSPDNAWWGLLMIAFGAVSSVFGILYAVVEKDIKRGLAFSSIENVGLIFMGLGLTVVFASYDLRALSAFALMATMYHVINHAIFKSLLFMGAGSVQFATHTKDMEKLGGLIKKMPWTALLFLIGCLAISGLPPFNGFVSEWMLLQSFLLTSQVPDTLLQISIAIASLAFALTIGISVATFVRLFGISFLSKPRSELAAHIREVPRSMLAGKSIVAALAIILGIMPFVGINLVSISFGLSGVQANPFAPLVSDTHDPIYASISMPTVLILLGCVSVGAFGFVRAIGGKTQKITSSTWDCGFGSLSERMQYTASSVSYPLRIIFRFLFRPTLQIQKELEHSSSNYEKRSVALTQSTEDIFEQKLYRSIISASIAFFGKIRLVQTGKVNAYVLYVMLILVVLLIYVRLQ
ncbi:MAG: hydrogenase 4 subunit B [Candidatus Nitrosotenuis sp.]|nr:MAG: hydrogenase 4 subunit B [Candidatus Nitrosotenuis sp.]